MDFKIIIIISAIIGRCYARDYVITAFISSYVLNEEKSTVVVLHDLCWSKKEQISLLHGIIKTGYRVSTDSVENMHHDHEQLFLLDLDCPGADETIQNISSANLLRAPFRWLFLSSSNKSAAKETLFSSSALADSDVVLAERSGDRFDLIELNAVAVDLPSFFGFNMGIGVHRPSYNLSMVMTPRGIFNGTYHDIRPRRELFRRRMDLMGHTLTMSNVIQDSNKTQYHLPREDGLDFENDATTKISWMVGKLAFLMLNATPRYIFSYRYGYKVDGQWSGMINDVHSGLADLGTNCVVTDPERLTVVTYTDTLGPFRVRFIFRQPPLSYVSNIYSLPFSTRVWIATALCAAISAVALLVASRWEAMFGMSSTQLDGGMGDALFLTMSALSQQGCVMEPRRNSGRVAVWSVFATLMALHAAYSANIVTLLQAPSHSVATLSQLVNSKITLAAYDVDYNHFIFAQYPDPVRVAVYKKIEPPKGKKQFYDLADGVEKIRQGLFAMHCITEPVYRRIELTFLENEKCDLMEIDFMNAFYPYAPMKKGSPYLELMRVAFKRIRETGVNSALNRRYQTPKPHCAGHISSFSSVGAAELRPVLILMAIGNALAIAILGIEILVHYLVNGCQLCLKPRAKLAGENEQQNDK